MIKESEIDRKAKHLREVRERLLRDGITTAADARKAQDKATKEKAEADLEFLPLRCCGTWERKKHKLMCPKDRKNG